MFTQAVVFFWGTVNTLKDAFSSLLLFLQCKQYIECLSSMGNIKFLTAHLLGPTIVNTGPFGDSNCPQNWSFA